MTVAELAIYSMVVCPFAQRTRMLLALKGIPFDLHELDLSKPRPADFLELNPSGKVPVIVHDGRVLNESSVINEYLDEVFPDPPLMPADPYRRAMTRIVIDYTNTSFIPALYRLLMNQDETRSDSLSERARETWRWLDRFLIRHADAGEWLWDEFGMAEVSIAPFFQRYVLNEHFRGFAPPGTDCERVLRWRDRMLSQPLTVETGLPEQEYIKLYEDYALGVGNGAVPPGRSKSSFDLSVPLSERPLPPAGLTQARAA